MSRAALKFWLILTFVASLLPSCSPSNFEILSSQELALRSEGSYESYLSLEYLDFARRLNVSKDKKTADYFSNKALKIIAGEQFIAENPLNWDSDPMQLEELTLTQRRLEALLQWSDLVKKLPIQLAHLSYLYDCWVVKESQPQFSESGETSCRTTYGVLLKEIENYAKNFDKKKVVKVEPKTPEFTRFEIFFDEESYDLNDKATREIIRVIKYLNQVYENYKIYLVGNGDSAAKNLRNSTIATNRARAVKNYLIKNGIAESSITLSNDGENFPDLIAIDRNQPFINRSVGLYVLRSDGEIPSYPMPLLQNLFYRQQLKEAKEDRGF